MDNARLLIRLKNLEKSLSPDSPALRRSLADVGNLIANQAKLNIRAHSLIDTGRLINSIRWQILRRQQGQELQVGSFGVPYARRWEFGFKGDVRVKAHERSLKDRVTSVREHMRSVNLPGKPYLRPAFTLHSSRIADMIAKGLS